jgi:hypothetical protein
MYDLGMHHLVDVYRRVGNDVGCMYILVQTGSVESVMSYCCLCTVVFYNLCNVCDSAVVLFTNNFYLQDRHLIAPSTKIFWNDFENGSIETGKSLQAIGCCPTITCQLTQRFQLENFWRRKAFSLFRILPTAHIWLRVIILGLWKTYEKLWPMS